MSDAEKRKRQAEEFKGKADYYKEVGNERAFAEYNDSYLQSEAGAAGARYFAARSRAENKNLTKKEREKNEKKHFDFKFA